MLNVIIVDDESFITKSLVHTMPWESLEAQVVGTFSNAASAIAFIQAHPVHLIITDIRMPGLSGLDLCDYVCQSFPHIQLIIISGYADFAYAQKAIRYNVLGYCIKPLDYSEIIPLIRRATTHMQRLDTLSYDIVDALENKDDAYLITYLERHHITSNHFYLMVSIGTLPLAFHSPGPYITVKLGSQKYIYFAAHPFDAQDLTATLSTSPIKGVGIYPYTLTLDKLYTALYETTEMAYQFFFLGSPFLCAYQLKANYDGLLNTIKLTLSSKHLSDINKLLLNLKNTTDFADFSIHFALKVWNLFMVYYTDCTHLELEDYFIHSIDHLYDKFHCFQTLLEHVSNLIFEKTCDPTLIQGHANTFMYVLQFINHNFMYPISLADISAKLNLNQSYISQLFRKEMGCTYTDYLLTIRMDRAKKLLIDTSLSLNEISEAVGYNDYFYFIKSFKKHVGISPGKYRTQGGVI